jgi:hypothetical protein
MLVEEVVEFLPLTFVLFPVCKIQDRQPCLQLRSSPTINERVTVMMGQELVAVIAEILDDLLKCVNLTCSCEMGPRWSFCIPENMIFNAFLEIRENTKRSERVCDG